MPNIQSVLDVIHHCYFVIVIVPNVANERIVNANWCEFIGILWIINFERIWVISLNKNPVLIVRELDVKKPVTVTVTMIHDTRIILLEGKELFNQIT
jgi:hypothetical protein